MKMTVEPQELSWAAWANATWCKSSSPAENNNTSEHRAKKKSGRRVFFSDQCKRYSVTKYTEERSNDLFISRLDIARNQLVSDSESAQFGSDLSAWIQYQEWLLNEKATKIVRGAYSGSLGVVEKICASKVYVKLIGDDKVVCINRKSIAHRQVGSFEAEIYENSLKSFQQETDGEPVSQTTEARSRRSKRLSKKAAQRRCTF